MVLLIFTAVMFLQNEIMETISRKKIILIINNNIIIIIILKFEKKNAINLI